MARQFLFGEVLDILEEAVIRLASGLLFRRSRTFFAATIFSAIGARWRRGKWASTTDFSANSLGRWASEQTKNLL